MHQHPYPTRFHGGIWKRPEFGKPYVRSPFNIVRPSQMAGLGALTAFGSLGCGAGSRPGEKGMGRWDTGVGVFRRPKVDGGGIFNSISGLGDTESVTEFAVGGLIAFGLVYLMARKKPMTANPRRRRRTRRQRS